MDLLNGYGSDSAEEEQGNHQQAPRSETAQPQQQQPQQQPQQPQIKLPPPNFDDEPRGEDEEGMPVDVSMSNPLKRSHQQVTGSSLVGSANKGASKSQKSSPSAAQSNTASARARAGSNPNQLLPPQLRGRPNVATEDVGKIFTQANLEAMRSKNSKQQQKGQSGSPSQQPQGSS